MVLVADVSMQSEIVYVKELLPLIEDSLVILHVRVTVDVPTTSNGPKDYTVKSWVRLFQTTFGLLLEQVLRPHAGGLIEPEVLSPNAGMVVAE